MHTKLIRGAAIAAIALLAGCSDSPTEPEVFEEQVVSPPVNALALGRTTALAEDVTVTQVIGRDGGVIELAATGLTVVVPKNAVEEDVTFTVTALAGDMLAYEFGPHGTQFKKHLRLTQRLDVTGWAAVGRPGRMEAGYFQSVDDIQGEAGEIKVHEFLPVIVDSSLETASFKVRHFSGYMLSTGRRVAQQ